MVHKWDMRSPDALWGPATTPTPDFYIAVIYDTAEHGQRAMFTCQRVIEQFNRDFLFHIALCDLAGFENAAEDNPALRQAMRAALVVIASTARPSDSFLGWLQRWGAEPGQGPKGIAVLTDDSIAATDTTTALQRMCHCHQIDFISPLTETLTSLAKNVKAPGGLEHEKSLQAAPRAGIGLEGNLSIQSEAYSVCGDKGGPFRG